MVNIIRWSLTLVLLIIVARHAHWSVTVAIALLTIGNEIQAAGLGRTSRRAFRGGTAN
jgi:hypothetical protein